MGYLLLFTFAFFYGTPSCDDLLEGQNLDSIKALKGCVPGKIPFKKLKNLEHLELNDLKLRDLSFLKGVKKLKTLRLNGNHIQDLKPLAALTELKILELAFNNFCYTDPLQKLTKLEQLNLAGNQITCATQIKGLKGLTHLKRLSLDHCNIEQLNQIEGLTGLKNLVFLSLGSNRLKKIDRLAALSNLEALWVPHNFIDDFKPVKQLKLKVLRGDGNPGYGAALFKKLEKAGKKSYRYNISGVIYRGSWGRKYGKISLIDHNKKVVNVLNSESDFQFKGSGVATEKQLSKWYLKVEKRYFKTKQFPLFRWEKKGDQLIYDHHNIQLDIRCEKACMEICCPKNASCSHGSREGFAHCRMPRPRLPLKQKR